MTDNELPYYPDGFGSMKNPCSTCKFFIEEINRWGCEKAQFKAYETDLSPHAHSCSLFEESD